MGELPYIIGAVGVAMAGLYILLFIVYGIASIIVGIKEEIDKFLSRPDKKSNKWYPINADELGMIIFLLGGAVFTFSIVLLLIDEFFLS